MHTAERVLLGAYPEIRAAASDSRPVGGATHFYYRYPACFSPVLAATVIRQLSKPGDLVLDPFVGGGTSIVESMLLERESIGTDISSLAVFVSRVKTTPLSVTELNAVVQWISELPDRLSYRARPVHMDSAGPDPRLANLNLARSRPIKKIVLLATTAASELPTPESQDFARCGILSTARWALDGRKSAVSAKIFRQRLLENVEQMVRAQYDEHLRKPSVRLPTIEQLAVEQIGSLAPFKQGRFADLVVTSPPYPGVHVLYHRWQIDGRRESPFPFWIAGSQDGQYGSHYTFGDRNSPHIYFERMQPALAAIRSVMRHGAILVQVLAFADPNSQLPRYLMTLEDSGFSEIRPRSSRSGRRLPRIWRTVPGRRWHANLRGATPSSREVVLFHQAT